MEKCSKCGTIATANAKFCMNCGHKLSATPTAVQIDYKKILISIGGITVIIFFFFFIQRIILHKAMSESMVLNVVLVEAAKNVNKTCPFMIDQETRLDNVTVLPDNILQYNYSFMTINRETADLEELKNNLQKNLTNNIRTNPDMQFYRDNEISFNYSYRDAAMNHLFTISITPEMYKENEKKKPYLTMIYND